MNPLEKGIRDYLALPRGLGFKLTAKDEAHDLHEGDLDGVRVLEEGQFDSLRSMEGRGGACRMLLAPAIVKEAETTAVQGRRSALGAIGLDVLATGNTGWIGRHIKALHPLPRRSSRMNEISRESG